MMNLIFVIIYLTLCGCALTIIDGDSNNVEHVVTEEIGVTHTGAKR